MKEKKYVKATKSGNAKNNMRIMHGLRLKTVMMKNVLRQVYLLIGMLIVDLNTIAILTVN